VRFTFKDDGSEMAEDIVYLSELLGVKVYDLKGRRIGTLRDAALVPLIDPVRLDRFLVGAGPGWLSVRYDQIQEISTRGIRLKDERLTPYHSDEYMLRMKRDLLDQQIIDSQGRKLVRVNDVTLRREHDNGTQTLHVLEVDIGVRSMVRRVLQGIVSPAAIRRVQNRIPPKSIRWEFCNILEPDPQRRVRLNISNQFLEKMHPADLADIVENLGYEDREALFSAMDNEAAAELLSEVDPDVKMRIFQSLETEKAAGILEEMEPTDAADVLHDLEGERTERILLEMSPHEKEEVEEALDYREDTAGSLISSNYVALPEQATVADGLARLRKEEGRLEDLHSLFLLDDKERLRHTVPLARLFFAPGHRPLKEFAADPFLFVHSHEKQDKIAEIFDRYNLLSLPVVDSEERLMGVIVVDDVVALLRQA
jgi:magnesium transporter